MRSVWLVFANRRSTSLSSIQRRSASHLSAKTRSQTSVMAEAASAQPSFVDTHVHVNFIMKQYNEAVDSFEPFVDKHFREASGGGWEASVHVCCDIDSYDVSLKYVSEHPRLYGAFGIHPHNAKDYSDEIEEKLLQAMKNPKVRAWGECGLDYHYNNSEPEKQREVFRRQIQKAVSVGKPLVVHTREAEDDTLAIMKELVPKDWFVHVHCFTSKLDFAKALLEHFPNLYLGFTGVVTFKSATEVQEVVKNTPLHRILLETDGPYMAPIPHRGKIATSAMIPHTAKKIAELKGVAVDEVLRAARESTKAVYGI